MVTAADVLVAMNRPSLEKFAGDVKPGGLLLYNAAVGDFAAPAGVRALAVPALELAREGGSSKALNTAMIGVLGGLGLADEVFQQALASQFAGKAEVAAVNREVYARARAWANQAGAGTVRPD